MATTDSEGEPTAMQVDGSERRLTREQPSADGKVSAPTTATAYDRKKSCPMYVRLFCRLNGHHRPEEFAPLTSEGLAPNPSLPLSLSPAILSDEVTIYTWWDATLRELADLLREVNEECRGPTVYFSFALVWSDLRGRTQVKPLGGIGGAGRGPSEGAPRHASDGRTLRDLRFLQGDFIDVAIYTHGKPSSPPLLAATRPRTGRRTDHHGWRDQRHGRGREGHGRDKDEYTRGRDDDGRRRHRYGRDYSHSRDRGPAPDHPPYRERSSRRSRSPPADRHHYRQ